MSITISNCQQICKSITNKSKSKMLYSFNKSNRFPKRKHVLCDKFYNYNPSIGNNNSRSTTFGYGQKYQFTQNIPNNPPPNRYSIQSQFGKYSNQGFGFGEGRKQMEITGPLGNTIQNKNPGPGTYQVSSTLNKSNFTLKIKHICQDKQKKQIPGPGSYPITFSINQNGQYFLSKHHNSCSKHFAPLHKRSSTTQKITLGPGTYNLSKQQMSPDGKYINSKTHNSLVRKFGKSIRNQINLKSLTPGPGYYKLPSQFGHYISKSVYGVNQQNSQKQSKYKSKQNKQVSCSILH